MRKHATAVFLMALLSVGALMAQGVAVTQPLNGLTTSVENQVVSYVFSTPSEVDQATVALSVDGVDYTIGAGLVWTPVNLTFNTPAPWAEGLHTLVLTADDTEGEPIVGTPLETEFFVDLSAPYMSDRTPGEVGEEEPIVTTDVYEPISLTILDDFGTIDPASIIVSIKGVNYDMTSLGVTLTEVDGGYLFEYDPEAAAAPWNEIDIVNVRFLTAHDVSHYGAPNVALPGEEYFFIVDAKGPECRPVDPAPFHREIIWSGCSDHELVWNVSDASGLNLSTFYIMINTTRYNWGNYRLAVDTLDFYEVYTDLGEGVIDTTVFVTEAQFTFTPNPYWYEGVVYTIHPPYVEDIYGNIATGWHFIPFVWPEWKLRFDNTGPTVFNPLPVPSFVTSDRHQPVSWNMTDTWGVVDPTTVHFIIQSTSGLFIEYDYWSYVFAPEITWDGLTMTYYPEVAGVTWPQGDTITVTVWDVQDSIEFCEPNHLSHSPLTWNFFVANGPMVKNLVPGNAEFTNCQDPVISFELIDPDGINPTSVMFQVEDVVFHTGYMITTIETVIVHPEAPPIYIPHEYFPFYQDPALPSRFILDMGLVPPTVLDFHDAQEINCTILEAFDLLANPMWGGPYSWRFWVDYSGPFVASTTPPDGGITGGPNPVFSIDIMDEICGMIDPYSVSIAIRGCFYHPMVSPGVFWEDIPGGGRVTFDCGIVGYSYAHGDVVDVSLKAANDAPEHICGVLGNSAIDLPYNFSFRVDNHVPHAEVVEPLPMTISACPRQPIIIEVTDDAGVDPTYFRMTVNHLVIYWGDPRLTWDGTYLTYTPTSNYPEGLVTWALTRVGDIAGNVDDETPLSGGFYADYTSPAILWTSPEDGSTAITVPDFLKIGTDDMAGIDPLHTQFVIDVFTDEETFETFVVDEATFPGVFEWHEDLSELWLNLEVAGITFDHEVYRVIVLVNSADAPDYACPDPNFLADFQFDFFVNPGWQVDVEFWGDETTMVDVYAFGAYFGATNEYDEGIDELLPPPPPTFTPLAFLTPGEGTPLKQDHRALDADTWSWILYTGSTSGCIRWNPEDLPALGSFVINGEIDMRGTDEYCFAPGEAIAINVTRRVMTLVRGWNLVSVPVMPNDPRVAAVFPMVDPANIWEYTGGTPPYVNPEVVQPGHAYMVLYTGVAPVNYTIPGAPLMEYTRVLNKGWQTIGSVYDFGGVSFLDPSDTPDGSCEPILYYLDPVTGMYNFSDVIVAGYGYWNLVNPPAPFASAELHVAVSYGGAPKSIPTFSGEPEWTTTLTFSGDAVRDITIGGHSEASLEFDRGFDTPIPPALPGATFDVFIEGTIYGRLVKDIRNSDGWTIIVDSKTPVEVNWTGDAPEGLVLVGMGVEIDITREGNAILNPGVYVAKQRVEVPTDFVLRGAAPNPFNAACGITFDIPREAQVSLEVYDVMGRKISTVANDNFEAGTHRVIWNGTDDAGREASSGVYFFRMTAGEFKASGRMVLVR